MEVTVRPLVKVVRAINIITSHGWMRVQFWGKIHLHTKVQICTRLYLMQFPCCFSSQTTLSHTHVIIYVIIVYTSTIQYPYTGIMQSILKLHGFTRNCTGSKLWNRTGSNFEITRGQNFEIARGQTLKSHRVKLWIAQGQNFEITRGQTFKFQGVKLWMLVTAWT